MECEASPSSSPMPPPVLPDIVDPFRLTFRVPTFSVSCYTDSFADLELAALLNQNDNVESLEKDLEDTGAALGSEKATFTRLERAFDKQKQQFEQTLKSLSEHTRQERIDDRNLRDL